MLPGVLPSPLDLNEPVDPNDLFAYGWRYVIKRLADGTEKTEQVPLTLEDILHPQEEDFRVLSDPHTEDTYYLRGVFRIALQHVPGATVLNDCRVAWDRRGKIGHGPDCAVIFNVREKQDWSTFNVVKEGTKPALIVEVTSPSTRSTDLVDKVREYAAHGVPHYVIADAHENETGDVRRISFLDYHLSPGSTAYFSLPLNDEGRVWLPELNLWLGVESGRLACFDVEGRRQGTHLEEHQARVEAEKTATDAIRERDEMAAKLQKWEAKLKPHVNGKNGAAGAK